MALTLDEFCSRLEHLRLDRSGGLVKPYKPLLVAAVLILIHKGKQPSRSVFLDGGLRSAFQQLLDRPGADFYQGGHTLWRIARHNRFEQRIGQKQRFDARADLGEKLVGLGSRRLTEKHAGDPLSAAQSLLDEFASFDRTFAVRGQFALAERHA